MERSPAYGAPYAKVRSGMPGMFARRARGQRRMFPPAMGDDHLYGQEHVERYRATDGEEGYIWRNGTEILLLTTLGRKSGEERTQALIQREVDGDYVIVASKGGYPI